MKKAFKSALALFLCVWMILLTGATSFAASETPYEVPESVKLNKTSTTINYGKKEQLTATVYPIGADSGIIWKSSDPFLVNVDAYGELTVAEDSAKPDKLGGRKTVTITAYCAKDTNISAKCKVTVDNTLTEKIVYGLKNFFLLWQRIFSAIVSAVNFEEVQRRILEFFNSIFGGATTDPA